MLTSSRKVSTNRAYSLTWKVFHGWCIERGLDPLTAKVGDILLFLQEGLNKGLSANTLRKQTAALSAVRGAKKGKFYLHILTSGFPEGSLFIKATSCSAFPHLELEYRAQGTLSDSP